jgi:hypothetical protein
MYELDADHLLFADRKTSVPAGRASSGAFDGIEGVLLLVGSPDTIIRFQA